ncbi:MAG: hypothetical protein HDR72_01370 [Ruminococcaceae bacterium]|nr:hypothetical protein [Oscillospiraceae bacterium]
MKKSAVILCAVLGTLSGLLITLIGSAAFGLAGGGISFNHTGEWTFIIACETAVMAAVCIPIQLLREKLFRKFGITAPVFIASVSAVPLVWSIYERAHHLYRVSHGGYSGFMGGLGWALTELFSLTWLVASIAFFAGQIIMALLFKFRCSEKARR